MQRLIDQAFANKEKDFIMQYRVSLVTKQQMEDAKEVSMSLSTYDTSYIPLGFWTK